MDCYHGSKVDLLNTFKKSSIISLPSKKIEKSHGSGALKKYWFLPALLGALALFGGNENDAQDSYSRGVSILDNKASKDLLSSNKCGIDALENCLPRLQKLSASAKRDFLSACMATAQHDQEISEIEFLILRGLAAAISCPMGPNLSISQYAKLGAESTEELPFQTISTSLHPFSADSIQAIINFWVSSVIFGQWEFGFPPRTRLEKLRKRLVSCELRWLLAYSSTWWTCSWRSIRKSQTSHSNSALDDWKPIRFP